ncbi:MAG: type II secretion system F family protein [Actinobacteria bacterium]|nr:MAG: type II secretion system F family protein [Actinomycetota bacterium]
MLATFAFVTFAAAGLLAYGLLGLAFSEDRRVSRRLADLSRYETAQARVAQPLLEPFAQRVLRPAADAVARIARALWPADYRDRLSDKLERAGRPRGVGIGRLATAKAAAALGTLAAFSAMAAFGGWRVGSAVLVTAAVTIVAFFVPDWWLDGAVGRRQHDVVLALPDMLDMLTVSVEAGLGFDAALSKLVRNSTGPLPEEFGRVLQEVQAGASRKEALRAMGERVDVPELTAFTSSIIQADIFGVSIARVLRTQADELRLRRRQRAEELAQKAPVKMVVPLVLCILPSTLIVIGGPAVVRIMGLFM